MKVLTDWIEGTPLADRPGMYLTRTSVTAAWLALLWDGEWWRWPETRERAVAQRIQWCGLAFDPATAVPQWDADRLGWFIPGAESAR